MQAPRCRRHSRGDARWQGEGRPSRAEDPNLLATHPTVGGHVEDAVEVRGGGEGHAGSQIVDVHELAGRVEMAGPQGGPPAQGPGQPALYPGT